MSKELDEKLIELGYAEEGESPSVMQNHAEQALARVAAEVIKNNPSQVMDLKTGLSGDEGNFIGRFVWNGKMTEAKGVNAAMALTNLTIAIHGEYF